MKAKVKSILGLAVFVAVSFFSSSPSSAVSQTFPLTATPNFGESIVQGFLESYKIEAAAISPTQTAVTQEGTFVYYTWALDLPEKPCPEASLQDLHLRASNYAEVEGDPDWSQIGVYTNDGSTTTMLDSIQQPVAEGSSASGLPYISRNNGALFGQYDIGINGPMDGVWGLAGYDASHPIGIVVVQDAEDGTEGLQTTLETIEVTFDTTACEPEDEDEAVVPTTTTTPSSPKTGSITIAVIAASAAIAAVLLTLKTAKKLKAKH